MLTFKKSYELQEYFCDQTGEALPSSLLKFNENIAISHAKACGLQQGLDERNLAFLISKQGYVLKKQIFSGDVLELVTTPFEPVRGIFSRETVGLRNGEEVVRFHVKWFLMDLLERKLLRALPQGVPFEMKPLENDEDLNLRNQVGELVKTVEIPYSKIDRFNHMNNCAYLDLISDIVRKPFKTCKVSYRKEIKEGSVVKIHQNVSEKGLEFVGIVENDKHFECLVTIF